MRKILLIEDNHADVELIQEKLRNSENMLTSADTLFFGLALLNEQRFDIVLLDLRLPDSSGIETFKSIQTKASELPIIVLTGTDEEEVATEAISSGAQDYLVKGKFDKRLLTSSILYAIERKRLEVELNRVSRSRSMILESAGEGILEVDVSGRIGFINASGARILHYSVDELLGKDAHELCRHPKHDPDDDCPLLATLREGTRHSGEARLWRKDDVDFPVDFTSSPLIENSSIVGAVVTFRDISERRRAEEEFKRLTRRTELILATAGEGIVGLNREGGIISLNNAALEILGYSREEVMGKSCGPFFQDSASTAQCPIDPGFRDGAVQHGQDIFRKKDGGTFPAEFTSRPLYDDEKILIGAVLTFRDITDRKRAEEIRAYLSAIVESTNVSIISYSFAHGAEGLIQTWNKGAEKMYGYKAEEVIGKHLSAIVPRTHANDVTHILETIKRGGTIEDYETARRRKDGTTIYISLNVSPIKNSSGTIIGLSGIARDVTERKLALEALAAAEKKERENREFLEVLLSNSRSCVAVLKGRELRYVMVNAACQALRPNVQMIGKRFGEVFPEAAAVGAEGEFYKALERDDPVIGNAYRASIPGKPDAAWDYQIVPLHSEDEEPLLLLSVWDVTEHKRIEEALRGSEERFRTMADNISQLAWMADASGFIFWYNKRWYDYTGASFRQMQTSGWETVLHPDDEQRVREKILRCFQTGEAWEDAFSLRDRQGQYRWFLGRAIPIKDEAGKVVRWFGTNTDITEMRIMQEEVDYMAHHDALTGLANRRLFHEVADVAVAEAKRYDRKLALFYMDLDRFKVINDTFGHETGDEILKEAARRLKGVVRTSDIAARFGGDEFTLLVSEIDHAEYAGEVARKIQTVMRKPFLVKGQEFNVSSSIGISIFPDDSKSLDVLLQFADIAMYHAKDRGRNMFRFFSPLIHTYSLERVRLENDLYRALERKEFRMYFQPLLDLKTKKIVSAEALIRWQHPEKGLLLPEQFFDTIRDTGLMDRIEEWVLESVARQIGKWKEQKLVPPAITVNVSPKEFQEADFASRVSRIIKDARLGAECLDIEITEAAAMSNVENSIKQMRELKNAGVAILIDDFGSGYSSLNQLKRLPVQKLKIDESFVRDIATNTIDRKIVTAVLLLAHSLNLKVVAEGVENETQANFLQVLHCDEVQGNFFSKPMPAEEFEELLAA